MSTKLLLCIILHFNILDHTITLKFSTFQHRYVCASLSLQCMVTHYYVGPTESYDNVQKCPGLLNRLELDYVLHGTPTEVCGPKQSYTDHIRPTLEKQSKYFALCGLDDPVQKKMD